MVLPAVSNDHRAVAGTAAAAPTAGATTVNGWSRGAEWHRWDPHIHTPATVFNNQFKGGWEEFIACVNAAEPHVDALGITNYFTLRGYQEVRRRWMDGKLPRVKLLFPNVELRLTIHTEKVHGLNLHLLFAPHDTDHVQRIEDALSRLEFSFKSEPYRCDERGLIRLGRAYDKTIVDDGAAFEEGARQFKVDIDQLRNWYLGDDWLRKNCLIGVAAGEDGTSGLKNDGAFAARKQDIQRLAHIIFSGKPSDRAFWLGKKQGHPPDTIRELYGDLKPCIHGCDAHDNAMILAPAGNRRCWVKGEVTFDALREVLVEPEERVWIGEDPPRPPAQSQRIRAVTISKASWIGERGLELNDGLVAIIGPRGSGKTALADMIAFGADAFEDDNQASFITKARAHIDGSTVELSWADGSIQTREFDPFQCDDGYAIPRVRYLSQQFVERLCGHDGLDDKLIREIESVVFDAIDEADRLGADSFAELRQIRTEPIDRRLEQLREEIRDASKAVATEDRLKGELKPKQAKLESLQRELVAGEKDLAKFVVKGKDEKVKLLAELSDVVRLAEARLAAIRLKKQKLQELAAEVTATRQRQRTAWTALQQTFAKCELTPSEWNAFAVRYEGDVDKILADASAACDEGIRIAESGPSDGDPPSQPGTKPLNSMRAERKKLEEELGLDATKERQFAEAQKRLAEKRKERDKLVAEIEHIGRADERRKAAAERRMQAYRNIFELLSEERAILEELYAPLGARMRGNTAASISKLEFYVQRRVDIDAWAARGEELLDLRKKGPFQGRGALAEAAKRHFARAWRQGGPEVVVAALKAFSTEGELASAREKLAADVTIDTFASWLFGTEHIRLDYGIRYDGVELERLSPGTRGIILLILYLALDQWDTRPLIVDQPEENLDPKSVFDDLVKYFRVARQRRQVIVVTHNANLVVSADADQVIIASSAREEGKTLPCISYAAGSLEDQRIREEVCQILEGGRQAFQLRDRKYRLAPR